MTFLLISFRDPGITRENLNIHNDIHTCYPKYISFTLTTKLYNEQVTLLSW